MCIETATEPHMLTLGGSLLHSDFVHLSLVSIRNQGVLRKFREGPGKKASRVKNVCVCTICNIDSLKQFSFFLDKKNGIILR